MIKLTATIAPVETRQFTIEAESYEQARELVQQQVPEGWRLISMITDR